MICPHGCTAVKYNWSYSNSIRADKEEGFLVEIKYSTCPNCKKIVAFLVEGEDGGNGVNEQENFKQTLIYPNSRRIENSEYIPKIYMEDYEEALKVLCASPKASAALSRRLLQNILREVFETQKEEIGKFAFQIMIQTNEKTSTKIIEEIGLK